MDIHQVFKMYACAFHKVTYTHMNVDKKEFWTEPGCHLLDHSV